MQLELKRPFLVIVGSWNPAIFQPEWIGKHIFEFADGDQFPVGILQATHTQVLDDQVVELQLPPVVYHEQVGIACTTDRLEIYINEVSDEILRRAEMAARKILSTLSHTPVGSYGVNFQFSDSEPDSDVTDAIETKEELARIKPILNRSFKNKFNFDDNCDLNLARNFNESGLELNFNFHHQNRGTENLIEQIPGIYKKYFELMRVAFGAKYQIQELKDIQKIGHDFGQKDDNGEEV